VTVFDFAYVREMKKEQKRKKKKKKLAIKLFPVLVRVLANKD
jgi:hypothetical protein